VAPVLAAIVHALVGLTLALGLGNAATAIAMMRMLARVFIAALGNGFVASVGDVALLFLRPIVVIPARHRFFSC
jgi:hypothetical protein